MRFWVLGASDPEMNEIERVLLSKREIVSYALLRGERVYSGNAYKADGLSAMFEDPRLEACSVECRGPVLSHFSPGVRIDHHRPDDPGFGVEPYSYMRGSSLGQVLSILKMKPTKLQRIIAAADHCLAAAYRGMCPGVNSTELMEWRIETRAAYQGRSKQEVMRDITLARLWLVGQKRAGEIIPQTDEFIPELPEASAIEGIPFIAKIETHDREKLVLQGAFPSTVTVWMSKKRMEGYEVYGDPARGFAGCFLDTKPREVIRDAYTKESVLLGGEAS